MNKTVKDILDEYKDISVPWNVWRFFGNENGKVISFGGDTASFGEDYGNIDELRNAVEWYVKQLGGKVKWRK